jgi:hypothetical protein
VKEYQNVYGRIAVVYEKVIEKKELNGKENIKTKEEAHFVPVGTVSVGNTNPD